MKKIIASGVIGAVAMFLILFVVGTVVDSRAKDVIQYQYPHEFKEDFMMKCTRTSDDKYCNCLLSKLQDNISYYKFKHEASSWNPSVEFKELIRNIVNMCTP